jgi:hypothetical protein
VEDFEPRTAPEQVRRRYLADGVWTDDSFTALTAAVDDNTTEDEP